ncbi:PQQ-binding-like beta-propeller repeat protein [Halosimplex rubrum]|uniref:PQQ-binding-like beta-propeller repeat protein n=1 Tax=Halosimplex rubrum TaxID=869889 RepID=A0A7D5T5Z8_9EURY|nr:PQQ-binding-like beta-propeller repeat protein [Halosimplex rubrum]QLH77355.1 PQQ-binding-like beta-propeller repeat protein [Halosimplex rubrum]
MDRGTTRRRVLRIGGIGCAVGAAGCMGSLSSSDGDGGGGGPLGGGGPNGWPRAQRDPAATGRAGGSGPTSSVETDWTYDLSDGYVLTPPVVVDGTVYAGDSEGVAALDAESGDEQWREEFDGSLRYLSVVDDRLYFESDGVRALDVADGSEVWRYDEVAERGSVTVADGTAYLAEWNGGLVAIDTESGERDWSLPTEHGIPHPPAVADGTAYFVTRRVEDAASHLVAVDVESGEESARVERSTATNHRPTVVDGTVYHQEGYETTAMSPSDGERTWTNDEGAPRPTSSFAHAGGRVYYGNARSGSTRDQAVALDASSGEQVWGSSLDGGVKGSPIVGDGSVYLGTTDGTVYGLDASSGETLWQHSVEGSVRASLALADGRLYVSTSEGGVHALAEA